MNKHILNIAFLLLILSSCGPAPKPNYNMTETEFDKAYAFFYGQYYSDENIEQNVVALDMFSPRLDLDSNLQYMVGTGTNFGFTDLFINSTDTILPEGEYTVDSTGMAMSFLPGMHFEGVATGCYLQNVVDSVVQELRLIDEGTFTLTQDGDTTDIVFTLFYPDGYYHTKYEAHFRGVIQYYIVKSINSPHKLHLKPKYAKRRI